MSAPVLSDAEFRAYFERLGGSAMARQLGMDRRSLMERRRAIELREGRLMGSPHDPTRIPESKHPGRLDLEIENGTVLIGSDAHYWPGIVTTAHRAFVKFCKELKPKAVIVNGDMLDGASISRHDPLGWEDRPSLVQEIETVKDRLDEIVVAAGKARRFWPLGNHDARLEKRLATVAPEYARVEGVHLRDHFPDFEPCWSVAINGHTIVKHRFKGGVHAAYNNTVHAGWSIFTGHLHKGNATPFTDLNGTRYGVDMPTMAEPFGPQFEYQEDNPRNHRSGFAVATFYKRKLLQPQMCLVFDDNHVEFQSEVIRV